ncbi:MAG: hypothetical protein IT374_20665 [Polyangiaceae bacterium]|nr:hypothetical protein [Polyangiaceae bacterium]
MARPKSQLSKFIEGLPADLPVKQVVARAKEAGFTTSESNVQRVRYLARKQAKRAGVPASKPSTPSKAAPSKAAPSKAAASAPSSEVAFAKLALQLGLDRADALLASLRARLLDLV